MDAKLYIILTNGITLFTAERDRKFKVFSKSVIYAECLQGTLVFFVFFVLICFFRFLFVASGPFSCQKSAAVRLGAATEFATIARLQQQLTDRATDASREHRLRVGRCT